MNSSIKSSPLTPFDGTKIGFISFCSNLRAVATLATSVRGLVLSIILTPAPGQPPMAEPVDPGAPPADPLASLYQ